jgi:hypothetical protein
VESPAEAAERPHQAAEPIDTPAGAPRHTLWGEPLGRLVAVALALFAVAATIVTATALRVPGISVFDETTHVDYAYQVAHGHIPDRGSHISPEIQAEAACRGAAANPDAPLTGCGKPLVGAGAQNYNFGHPPLYYAITGVLARAANYVIPGPHFITFARLVGVLWLFAGMLVMYLALRRFRVRWTYAAGGGLLLALTPAIYYYDGYVTNDAAAALAGSAAVFALARVVVDGKLGWRLPAVLAALAAATKILNALPFLAIALILGAMAFTGRRADPLRTRQLLKLAVGMIGGVLVIYLGWTVFQNLRGDPNWVNPVAGISSQAVHGAPFDELFSTSFSGITQLSSGYVPAPLANDFLAALLRIWGPLSVAAIGALFATHERWSPRFVLAGVTTLGVLTFPLAVEIQIYVSSGKYFPVMIPRYGMSLIPLFLAGMALAAEDRRLKKSFAAFIACCLAIALFTVFHS